MKNAAVIAEYNPFHNGHLRQLNIIRSQGADTVTVVMNGDHVQRGEPALAPKHIRAEAAVRCGADLVVELPFVFGISSAEGFATGGVELLNGCGVIDTLCFGSEKGDTESFISGANSFFEADRQGLIKKYLDGGYSYPRAVASAMTELGAEFIPESPNDLLAFEYVKALMRSQSKIAPFTHTRDSDYLSEDTDRGTASASAVRRLISENKDVSSYVPETAKFLLENAFALGKGCIYGNFEKTVLALLRQKRILTPEPSAFGINEGLCQRILKYSHAESLEELYTLVKTKRYTMSAVRRTVLTLAYGIEACEPKAEYIRVLAFNGKGRELLAEMRKKSALPVYHTLPSDMKQSPTVRYEALASDLYGLYMGATRAAGEDFRLNSIYVS